MIFDRLRRKKKPEGPQISRKEFLAIRPVRNPMLKWEKDDEGKIKITVPLVEPKKEKKEKKKKRKLQRSIFSKLTSTPKEKRIQLDVIGSIVWELCDGEKTVEEIIEYLHNKYKILPNEAEISLNTYFKQLSKRGLVGFILPKEAAARLQEKEAEKQKT